jgi:ADP-ribose pyrophosphatase
MPKTSGERSRVTFERISTRPVYGGRLVRLDLDRVRYPDGSESELEIVRHPGAAAVLPVLGETGETDPDVVLIRQYRQAVGGPLLEIPAGLPASASEDWEACARRELREETGYEAERLHRMTRMYTSPGFTDEVVHLFAATGLTPGETAPEEDEFIDVVTIPFHRALEMVREGRIIDAKSIAALLYAAAGLLPNGIHRR